MKKLLLTLTLLLLFVFCSAQIVKFETVAQTNGIIDHNNNGQYKWSSWKRDTTSITFALQDSFVVINDKKFEILEKPKKWNILKDRKYVDFHCIDESMNKTHIRIVEFDKKHYHFSVKVFGEQNGQMFRCIYIDN